jgi:hypothetical protein
MFKIRCVGSTLCLSFTQKSKSGLGDNDVYQRMCGTEENCSGVECEERTCDVTCCSRDLCNLHGAAAINTVSGIILSACVAIHLILNINDKTLM